MNAASPPGPTRIAISTLADADPDAVVAFARRTWDRPDDPAYLEWRYRDCPVQDGAVAMRGDTCVATMFAMRRPYHTPGGPRVCLEPFDWFTTDDARASGAGLRVVRHLMAREHPVLALGGTAAAVALFSRLGWTQVALAKRFNLPRRERYLRARGRGAVVSWGYDLASRGPLAPFALRAPRGAKVQLELASQLAPAAIDLACRQRRFSLMRIPDPPFQRWLAAAPPALGLYLAVHVRQEDELVGWATVRVHATGGVRTIGIQQFFLAEHARESHRDVLRRVCALLDGLAPDVIAMTSSCPDTIAALEAMRFRFDADEPVFAWWGGGPPLEGPALIDAGHAEWAVFPIATAGEARWMSLNPA